MNIHDVEKVEYPATCWLEAIFARQTELLHKYHGIEKANGLLQTEDLPVNINDRFGQARIKDFAWRFTEELGESLECLQQYTEHEQWSNSPEVTHFREELADALHFLTELSIMVDLKPDGLVPSSGDHTPDGRPDYRLMVLLGDSDGRLVLPRVSRRDLEATAFQAIMELALACNTLKNKPWKQTQLITDAARFREHLKGCWFMFGQLLYFAGYDARAVYDMYFRKSEVNKFRQRSKY